MDHDLVMICAGRVRLAATRKKTPCHFHKGIGLMLEKFIAGTCFSYCFTFGRRRQCYQRSSNCLHHQLTSLLGELYADGYGAIVKDLAATDTNKNPATVV